MPPPKLPIACRARTAALAAAASAILAVGMAAATAMVDAPGCAAPVLQEAAPAIHAPTASLAIIVPPTTPPPAPASARPPDGDTDCAEETPRVEARVAPTG